MVAVVAAAVGGVEEAVAAVVAGAAGWWGGGGGGGLGRGRRRWPALILFRKTCSSQARTGKVRALCFKEHGQPLLSPKTHLYFFMRTRGRKPLLSSGREGKDNLSDDGIDVHSHFAWRSVDERFRMAAKRHHRCH